MNAATKVLSFLKEHHPKLPVLVRARNRQSAYKFISMGFSSVYRETFDSALELSGAALRILGFGAYETQKLMHRFRKHDEALLHRSAEHHQDEKTLIDLAKQGRADFEELLRSDEKSLDSSTPGWNL
jgi:CPA2 family monovalent cation:H+ antiporter-2